MRVGWGWGWRGEGGDERVRGVGCRRPVSASEEQLLQHYAMGENEGAVRGGGGRGMHSHMCTRVHIYVYTSVYSRTSIHTHLHVYTSTQPSSLNRLIDISINQRRMGE